MSTEIDDIKDIGEEEYIIMNLDSRQMETDGTHWFVKNMKENAVSMNQSHTSRV